MPQQKLINIKRVSAVLGMTFQPFRNGKKSALIYHETALSFQDCKLRIAIELAGLIRKGKKCTPRRVIHTYRFDVYVVDSDITMRPLLGRMEQSSNKTWKLRNYWERHMEEADVKERMRFLASWHNAGYPDQRVSVEETLAQIKPMWEELQGHVFATHLIDIT